MKFNLVTVVIHNPSMRFILCLVITFFITSIHAGHKRFVIRVPQRTKHIHHHTVKKVPIYVLLPAEKKPKIFETLEDVKPVIRNPCSKDVYELPTYREDTLNHNRFDKEKSQEWMEDQDNRGAYYVNNVETYRTIEEDFPPPPPLEDLRRVNVDQQSTFDEYRQHSIPTEISFTYPPPENQNHAYQYRINR